VFGCFNASKVDANLADYGVDLAGRLTEHGFGREVLDHI
jgi:hypothetical protein